MTHQEQDRPPEIAYPSVASLQVVTAANGTELGPATAFLVTTNGDDLWLVTNWHVLSGRNADTGDVLSRTGATPDSIRVACHRAGALGEFVDLNMLLRDEAGRPVWKEHAVHGRAVDVAVLALHGAPFHLTEYAATRIDFHTYRLPEWDDPMRAYISIGERLSVVGFPFAEHVHGFPIWTQGFVASELALPYRDLPCFLIDSRTRQGQSGSPVVFYSEGGNVPAGPGAVLLAGRTLRFLGIYSGRINAESDIGRVWRTSAILEVLHDGTLASCL